ncbi:AMP-binding protein [Parvularcula marina]|uniref:AMP-binding protein n=1 Tax=Parvularcula marina TaxID=2292771 RepID=UPI0035181147
MIDGAMQDFVLTLDKFLTHAAKWHPDAEIVTAGLDGESTRIGYAGLMERSKAVSSVLAGLDVKEGERVATLAWNTQAHLEAWFAIMGMGAVCHTLNPRLTPPQLGDMVCQSEARILVVSADLLPLAHQMVEHAPGLARILVIDGEATETKGPNGAPGVQMLERLIEGQPQDVPWGDFLETAPCGLCFTSGTTGQPKGVTYTHRSSFMHTLRLLQTDVMAFSGTDSILTVVPMFHANAWGIPFAAPAIGAKLVLPGRQTNGANLAHLIETENVTVGVGVPTVWLGLLEHVEAAGIELPTLKRIIMGGAPLPPALLERIERRLGASVQSSWGMTELSPSGTVTPKHEASISAQYAGKPAIGVDLLLKDESGKPLANQRGEEGHLFVRGAAVLERYFGQEELATDEDGWFRTGDLAKIDGQGRLAITGRAKDLIKSGGEWINPAEIEAVIGALPEVSLAAVIGRTDPKWGERPILLVETLNSDDVSDEALLEPLRSRFASWWIPDAVVRLPSMPLAPTGKIDKMRLRAEYGELDPRRD